MLHVESPISAEVVIAGRRFTNFAGSSYLGLSANPEILAFGAEALRKSGAGYQFPRNYGLAAPALLAAEQEACCYFLSEAAMYLAGGYYFGLAVLPALSEQFGVIAYDALAHHALREAIASSSVPAFAYAHRDSDDLASQLRNRLRPGVKPLIVTDGLFSTYGEIAPLEALVRIATAYGGRLLVDESHSFGVLGATGRGACEHHNVSGAIIGGSTAKAFGVSGGILLATAGEVDAFRETRVGRGAAPGLPAAAAMLGASLRYAREHPQLLEKLRENVVYLKSGLRRLGLAPSENLAPIASFELPDEAATKALQRQLFEQGIFVFHSRYVGAGVKGVIRCGIFADHRTEHLDLLLDALARLL